MFLVFLAAIGSGAGAEDEAPSVLRSMLLAFVREASGCDSLPTVLTDSDKDALVAKHNDYRSKAAGGEVKVAGGDTLPKASNMKKLKWDDALAKTAQATADKCDGKTRETAATALDTGSLTGVHQNIGQGELDATSKDVGTFVNDIVKSWYTGASATFKPADLDSFPKAAKDADENFAQLVWADTELVGCGFKHYKANPKAKAVLACNYYPGLKSESQVYKKGDPCADCGTGYKCDSTKLCAKDGGDSTSTSGESKAGGGSSAVAIIGILAVLVAVGGVIVGLVLMHRTKARAAAAAHAAVAAPAAASASASAGEQGAAAGSHEAAAGDAADHKGSPGAEAEKTAEAHESPAKASHDALAHK